MLLRSARDGPRCAGWPKGPQTQALLIDGCVVGGSSCCGRAWHKAMHQREAEAGQHERQRGAREDQRQRLVGVAHDRALGPDDLDRGRAVVLLRPAHAGVVGRVVAAAEVRGREGRLGGRGGLGAPAAEVRGREGRLGGRGGMGAPAAEVRGREGRLTPASSPRAGAGSAPARTTAGRPWGQRANRSLRAPETAGFRPRGAVWPDAAVGRPLRWSAAQSRGRSERRRSGSTKPLLTWGG